ncbi:MAG: FAD-dependent oxidoreductase [Pseudomonadota bacterium]
MTDQFDVCVIGAGISGSSFAYRCAKDGASVVVLEKEAHPGGCIKSHRYNDGLVAELGTRTLTNSYRTVIELLEDAGADHLIEPLETSKFKLAVGGEHRSIFRQLSLVSAALSLPKMFGADKSGKSLKAHYGQVFGQRNYDRLFRHAFAAVLSQPADDYPAELLFRKRARDKTRPKQFTLKGGNLTLVETLLGHGNIELKPSVAVTSIKRRGDAFLIAGEGCAPITAQSVAIAVPSDVASHIAADIAPDLAGLLGELTSGRIHTVHVALERTPQTQNVSNNLIGVDKPYYSVIHTPGDARDVYCFHFNGAAPPTDADLPDIIAEALQCDADKIDIVSRRDSVLPHLSAEQLTTLGRIETYLETADLFLPCNYIQGLSVEDCCLQSQREYLRWTERRLSSVHDALTGL